MRRRQFENVILVFTAFLGLSSCVEEIDVVQVTETNESILVVEANLTNVVQKQEVLLSRSIQFNADSIESLVNNARVQVVDENGAIYLYDEISPGRYVSRQPFSAFANLNYQLEIDINGKRYNSLPQKFTNTSLIERIYAEKVTTLNGQVGVGIFIDAQVANNGQTSFRFKYEETYKIIAPLWNPLELVVLDRNPPFSFGLEPREEEQRVCYQTKKSNELILNEVGNIQNGTLRRFMVRFIPEDDYIISHRYSILVNQFVVNENAFAFYQNLKNQSTSDNVFTEVQPGFIEGNIVSQDNPDELVIGYFDVTSQAQKRIFFDYEDFFSIEGTRPFPISCSFLTAPATILPDGASSPLMDIIDSGLYVYVGFNGQISDGGPYLVARRECGDCTALGSNVIPEFWEE